MNSNYTEYVVVMQKIFYKEITSCILQHQTTAERQYSISSLLSECLKV